MASCTPAHRSARSWRVLTSAWAICAAAVFRPENEKSQSLCPARARGSRFALVSVSDAVRAVLELARLDRVFLIVADRAAMLG